MVDMDKHGAHGTKHNLSFCMSKLSKLTGMMVEGLVVPITLSQMTNFRLLQIERVCRRQFQI